jgi:hypothetical protein
VNYSKGISWIDDCRIPFVDDESLTRDFKVGGNTLGAGQYGLNDGRKTKPTNKLEGTLWENTQGRFPANILVSDDMLNDGVVSKSGRDAYRRNTKIDGSVNFMAGTEKDMKMLSYDDKGTNSRYYDIDKWFNNLIDV